MQDNMSMSPEVQAFGQGTPGPDQTENLFKQKFNEMAYGVLFSKFANLTPHVVTFKILEVTPDEGRGIGVFIVNYAQRPIYIPVVLMESQLKPMEMFYSKDQNIFLPLTTDWLDEISKMNLGDMGDGAKLPKEVPQDVNIQDLVVPPVTTTGRYGYASDESQWEQDSKRLFKEAEFQPEIKVHGAFLDMVRDRAPKVMLDGVKLAFERNPALLQKFASNYGTDVLVQAMQEGYGRVAAVEKTASVNPVGEVTVFTKVASSEDLRAAFGSNTSEAFSRILSNGFAVADTRTHIEKVAVRIEGPTFLASPGPESGWFKLYFSDGEPGIYFVIPFPTDSCGGRSKRTTGYGENKHRVPIKYLVVSKDGKDAWTSQDIVGEKVFETTNDVKNSKIGKLLNQDKGGGDTPTVGSYGFFINTSPFGMEATEPFRVETVSTDGGIKRIVGQYHDSTYIIDGDPSRKKFDHAMGGSLMYLPNTSKFVQLLKVNTKDENSYRQVRDYERKQKNSVIKDPKVLMRYMNRILSEKGATPVNVKSAGLNEWWVGRTDRALTWAPALQKVARLYKISAEDAAGVLIDAQQHGNSTSFILDHTSGTQVKVAFDKLSQPPMEEGPMQYQSNPGQQQGLPAIGDQSAMGPATGQEMTPPEGGMDPMDAMQPPPPEGGMDPMDAMQPPPPPAPMSPTDLAIGEAVDGLQQQTQMQQQQTEAQMQQLQQQVDMQQQNNQQLVQVLQGIQQRSSEISAATGGQIPAGAEQSPAMAAQALAPVPPEEPPPPPTPMMSEGEASPEMVADQINPEMVDQASEFQDQGMFDTAAIAMLAAAPVLQDIVASYVPNLEKGVDNLGRVLLTLWMKEKETKEAVGDEQFISLEEKLRTVFKNLGDVVLSLSHNAVNAQSEADRAQEMMQAT